MHLRSLSVEALRANRIHEGLLRYITKPDDFASQQHLFVRPVDWTYFVPDDVTEVIPLWADNADAYVRWIRGGRIEYIQLHHDDPQWTLLGRSEQGLMAELFRQFTEAVDGSELYREWSQKMGFLHWEVATNMLDNHYEAFRDWARSL